MRAEHVTVVVLVRIVVGSQPGVNVISVQFGHVLVKKIHETTN